MAFFSGICGSFAEFCVCFCPKFPAFWSVFCLRISTLRHWNWHPNKSVYQNCGETSGSKFQCFLFLGGTLGDRSDFNYPQRTAEPPKNHTGPWQTTARQGRKDAQAQQCQHPEMKWMTDCFHGQDFLVCFAFQTFTPITNMCLWSKRSTWTVPGQYRVDFLWRIHIWHRHGWSQVSGSTRSMTQLLTVHIRHQIQKENERNQILIPWIQPSHVSFGRLRCPVQWTVFRRRLRGRRQCQGNVLDMWRTHGEQRTPQHTRTFWANTHERTFSWNGQVEANDPVYVTGHVIVRKWSTNECLRTDWKEPVTK